MKRLLILTLALTILLFSGLATAQMVATQPGCDSQHPCLPPPAPPIRRTVPSNDKSPVKARKPSKTATPPGLIKLTSKDSSLFDNHSFLPWGISFILSVGNYEDDASVLGTGLAFYYLFDYSWGIEATLEGFEKTYNNRPARVSIIKTALNLRWYTFGINRTGLNMYFKGGVTSQRFTTKEDDYESTMTGTSLQVGGGLVWRYFDGMLSSGVEGLYVTSPYFGKIEGAPSNMSSYLINFTFSLHF
jgi:hypothetical protein